jgi:hypothetical protein
VKAAQHEALVGMGPGGLTMTNQTRFNVGYAIAAIFLVFMIQYAVSVANQIAPIPYSDFQRLMHEGKIATVGVSDRFMEGSLKEPLPGWQKHFVTTRVDPQFAGELDKYGVRSTCACRKSNPDILVVQSAQGWATKNVPGAIDGARDRCIFLQG